jgi:D-serine deaminase-like pyridoxal phosphate-dependent protein
MTESQLIGAAIENIDTPALLLDLDILDRNIARMAALVANTGIALRPHVKTHKSPLIAHRQMVAGAGGVCCAKVSEAEVMVAGGIPDVLVTTPVVAPEKLRRLISLARQATVGVVVDDLQNVKHLSEAAKEAGATLHLLIEINVGQQRCGLAPGSAAADLADEIARLPGVRLRGLQGYHGALQQVVDLNQRASSIRQALDLLLESAQEARRRGHAIEVLTGGGTGSSSTDIRFHGLTELQPGSYVFMDCNYSRIQWEPGGALVPFGAAITILTSVVSCAEPDRIIVDAGWKSASCDSGAPTLKTIDGATFTFAGDEHGKVSVPQGTRISVGDKLELVPSHCDTTVNLYDRYVCVRNGKVDALWPVAARGKTQ